MDNLSISAQKASMLSFAKPQHKAAEPPIENPQPEQPAPEQLGGPKEMCGRSQVAFSGRLTSLPSNDLNYIASKLKNNFEDFSREELSAFKHGLTEALNDNHCRSLKQLFAKTDTSDMVLSKTYLNFADTIAKDASKTDSEDIKRLNSLLEACKKEEGCKNIKEFADKILTSEEDAFSQVANYMTGDKFSDAFKDLFLYR